MFRKELLRLKAVLNNNISACYCSLNDFKNADRYNNLALVEDQEYAKVYYRKILVLEGQARYKEAASLADWGVMRFDSQFEDEENQKIVPRFKELKVKMEAQFPFEEERRTALMKEEVERELRESDPEYEINQMKEKEISAELAKLLGDDDDEEE